MNIFIRATRATFLAGVLCTIALLLVAAPLRADTGRVTLELRSSVDAAAPGQAVPFEVIAHIQRGWHINAHRPAQPYLIPTELRLELPAEVGGEAVVYPEPERRRLAFAGDEELLVYTGDVPMRTRLLVSKGYSNRTIPVDALLRYQACNDRTCLPPTSVKSEIVLPVAGAASTGAVAGRISDATAVGHTRFDRWLAQRGLLFTLLAVGLIGLGLNLTPCVYPLISVTVAYFGGQSRSRAAVARLAGVYVLGIALSFSALGLTAALSGGLFGAALQRPIVVVFVAGILVVLALGSFGLYQFQPPAALMRRAGGASSGALGALFMGLTMGIVAAPCVGPIVVGLLVFVGSRQDPWLGFSVFFALALGMGAPYLLLAIAAGSLRRLPRSGEWLVWTERLFGCVLLALAAYFITPLLPPAAQRYLLPGVVALSGVYLGFLARAGSDRRGFVAFKRISGIALLVLAFWFVQSLPTGGPAIDWQPATVLLQKHDGDPNRPTVIDFAAEWCIPCRQMDHTTYVDPDVVREAKTFRMVRADLTREDTTTEKLVEKYDVRGVPTVIVLSGDGQEQERMVGYVGPAEMLAAMRTARQEPRMRSREAESAEPAVDLQSG